MRFAFMGFVGASLGVLACGSGSASGEDLPASAVSEAKQLFAQRCVVCHGASGKGDGQGAAALDPKPRDFSAGDWQSSVTDDHIEKIILGGGPAVGKNASMPANPDLEQKPQVVKALRREVRSFGKR